MEFLGIYQPVVYRMARRRGLQDADAQDVIQQVFVSIARSIDAWKAGDFEITDPKFQEMFDKIWLKEPKGAIFASPSQIKEAFDPAVAARFIVPIKFQKHLYHSYGGGRALMTPMGIDAFDAQRKCG